MVMAMMVKVIALLLIDNSDGEIMVIIVIMVSLLTYDGDEDNGHITHQ